MLLKIVNPVVRKSFKRKKKRLKKSRRKNSNSKLKPDRKGYSKLAARKRRRKTKRTHNKAAASKKRTYKRRRTNPVRHYKMHRKHTYKNRRRTHRRRHHNPVDFINGGSTTDLIMKSGAAAVGGVSAPWLSNMFGISGNMKYAAQFLYAIVGAYLLKSVGMGKYSSPFAFGVIAVTGYQFASDKGLLLGYMGPQDYSNIYAMNSASQLSSVPIAENVMLGSAPLQSYSLAGNSEIVQETENKINIYFLNICIFKVSNKLKKQMKGIIKCKDY